MNQPTIESLAQTILALSPRERDQLYQTLNVVAISSSESLPVSSEILDLQKRLQEYETQYQMSSPEFYQLFRAGKLGDSIDFFEWSVYYEMLTSL
jgi:hypothetical protein